jgi:hypothetical protein
MRTRPAATPPDGIPVIFVVMGTRRAMLALSARCPEVSRRHRDPCPWRQMKYSRQVTSSGNSAAGPSYCPLTDESVASMLIVCPSMTPLM